VHILLPLGLSDYLDQECHQKTPPEDRENSMVEIWPFHRLRYILPGFGVEATA
jgi:hypothetical protein